MLLEAPKCCNFPQKREIPPGCTASGKFSLILAANTQKCASSKFQHYIFQNKKVTTNHSSLLGFPSILGGVVNLSRSPREVSYMDDIYIYEAGYLETLFRTAFFCELFISGPAMHYIAIKPYLILI